MLYPTSSPPIAAANKASEGWPDAAIKRYGISMVIGLSFAEIFAGNCRNIGIPVATVGVDVLNGLFERVYRQPDTLFGFDLEKKVVSFDGQEVAIDMDDAKRDSFLAGSWDSLGLLKANKKRIDEVGCRLPYVSGEWG